MNEFFKLLRDFIIFIPLGVLVFGVFFSLIAVTNENFILLIVGLFIVLYGLIASYVRQIYKDHLHFLRKEMSPDSAHYLAKWKKYHRYYYIGQFLLLGIFIYFLWHFISVIEMSIGTASVSFPIFTPLPFWQDFEFWSVVVLAITVYWLIKYTRATEKMAEYQIMPAVEVNMIYDKGQKKTYFWFSNASKIPAFVLIKIDIKNGEEKKNQTVGPLRIPSDNPHYYEFRKTATAFDFLEGNPNNLEVVLSITATPALDNNRFKFNFTKSYKFNESESRWDETSWGYPDPSFPIQN